MSPGNKIKTYTCLEQRMADNYLIMLSDFVPDKNAKTSIKEQEDFYKIIKSLYQLAFDEPLLFTKILHEDDVYPNRYKKSYGKPELINNMRKYMLEIDILVNQMYLMGQGNEFKINNKQKNILKKLGITEFYNLPPAWVWMANRPESKLLEFKHCFFDKNYPYLVNLYASLLGKDAFFKLEKWMTGRGYKKYIINNITASDCKLVLTYANPLWSTDIPRGGYEYKIRHTGISVQYDFYIQNPIIFGLCIPNGLKNFLPEFNSMSSSNQKFIINRTKKCDKCRYCIQTDKTGKRPLAFINVNYEQTEYSLCPYFPGYSYSWSIINDTLADQLIEMLSFMDSHITR